MLGLDDFDGFLGYLGFLGFLGFLGVLSFSMFFRFSKFYWFSRFSWFSRCHLPNDLCPIFCVPTSVKPRSLLFNTLFQQIGRFTVSSPIGKAMDLART